jgi:hypothetical protein
MLVTAVVENLLVRDKDTLLALVQVSITLWSDVDVTMKIVRTVVLWGIIPLYLIPTLLFVCYGLVQSFAPL